MGFEVIQVPVWQDNYAYVLAGEDGTCALVDSPEAGPILEVLEERQLTLTHIFQTHHHPDHVGANRELIRLLPGLEVWGGAYDLQHGRIPGQTRALRDGEELAWAGERCVIREIPAHTLGHIAWFWSNGAAFVGDTMFFGGCGRLFEGTAEQLDRALYDVIGELDPQTLLYCAHEYTEANLRFAASVDPDNEPLSALRAEVSGLREQGLPTVPSRLEQEWAVNPFLRCDTPEIRDAVQLGPAASRHEVLGALRSMKDGFSG